MKPALRRLVEDDLRRLVPAAGAWPGVVAVSGGADSVALCRVLHELAPAEGLVVAHLNHQLRGVESDTDEAFVRELAEKLGRPFRTHRIDIAARAEDAGSNLEAAAREARYTWLAEVAAEYGAGWIATGHTADDQAETVLHRLIRGAGMQGLRGIAERRTLETAAASVEIIRPMLAVTRRDVIAYLAGLEQPYREDASNADARFTRNRIRHELLPLLRSFNPAIADILGRLATQAEEHFADQEELTAELTKAVELPRAGPLLILDTARLAAAPRPRIRAVFRHLWQREGWSSNGMSFAHWQRAAEVAAGERTAAEFPGGLQIRRIGNIIQVGPRQ